MSSYASQQVSPTAEPATEQDYDATLSRLIAQITHHSIKPSKKALPPIVETIESLLGQPDLEFYPKQQAVLLKLHKLWLMCLSEHQPKH